MLPTHDPASVLGNILERHQTDALTAVFVDPLALQALVGPSLDHRPARRHLEVVHRGELHRTTGPRQNMHRDTCIARMPVLLSYLDLSGALRKQASRR